MGHEKSLNNIKEVFMADRATKAQYKAQYAERH